MPVIGSPIVPSSTTADTTSAEISGLTGRKAALVDSYIDSVLHDFRQLRVWDEHARRSGVNSSTFRLTYKPMNPSFTPEVYNGQQVAITSGVSFSYPNGTFSVGSDDGNQDYFVTYEFNRFPSNDLSVMLDSCLMEINATAEADTHLTAYETIDETPNFWDGPLTMGVLAKAFRRLATDSALWANWLIFQDGATGQQLAGQAAIDYQTMYDDMRRSVKRGNFIAGPTDLYSLFRTQGVGSLSAYNGMFRSYFISRSGII